MNDTAARFVGAIPETYDRILGPFLFTHYARDLAARLDVPPGGHVLEVACGTGVSTEAPRAALDDTVRITATDLNPPMIERAEARRGHLAGVAYRQADAQELAFGDATFDAVLCQFGVMFLPDKPRGFGEAFRVLKPGGQILFNVWDSLARNPIIALAQEVISEFFATDPPQFLSVPFGWYDQDVIRAHLADAGFGDIAIAESPHDATHSDVRQLATGMVTGNPTILEIEERGSATADEVIAALAGAHGRALWR
jgi:ubiquinone/menaquinone biosynthesis C-methylase UbiE